MRKLLVLLVFSLFLITLVTASPTYKQGQTIQLGAVCDNCTNANLTKVTFPNGTYALLGQFPMTKNGTNYNYTFSNTATQGLYEYVTCGDLNGILTCDDSDERVFQITGSGLSFDVAKSIFYIFILCLLGLLFILTCVGIVSIPSGNARGDGGQVLSINWLKYLKSTLVVIAWGMLSTILFLSSAIANNYIESGFSDFLFMLFKLSIIFAVPMVVLYFIWLIVNILQDKNWKKLLDDGISKTW